MKIFSIFISLNKKLEKEHLDMFSVQLKKEQDKSEQSKV